MSCWGDRLHLLLGLVFAVVFTWPFLAIERPIGAWAFLYVAWAVAIGVTFALSLGVPAPDEDEDDDLDEEAACSAP